MAGETGIAFVVHGLEGFDSIDKRLRRLERASLDELLDVVGEVAESQTRDRIENHKESPDGVPWADWSEGYAGHKHGASKSHRPHPNALRESGGHSILQLDGGLLDSIDHNVDGDTVTVGSNLIYAAAQQFGYEKTKLPARPYLGLSDANRDEIEHVVADFISEALR